MNSDSENEGHYGGEGECDLAKTNNVNTINLLPEKSKKKYEATYKNFLDWRARHNLDSFCENIVLKYFEQLSEKYKSSSLWAQYSMLRSTLIINNNVNIENYRKLKDFLKYKSQGYTAKKAKTFSQEEINRFINEAPDEIYLATKVALIMGIMGGCHANELHSMAVEDLQDFGSAMLVSVPNNKTKIDRKFILTGQFYEVCKKYAELRPLHTETSSFFLNYQKGKCTIQNIGINKFGSMGKQIARYLKLPNPEEYTGHSFRRSSATLFNASRGISSFKQMGDWEPNHIPEEYLEEPIPVKVDMGDDSTLEDFMDESKIDMSFDNIKSEIQSTSSHTQNITASNETFNFDVGSQPAINFINCSNITINFVRKNDK
ncbi:unnamed protein product [Brassicogethes aeneus]|uniref:Tyr recombinase domain-containing protein n=1 Tax=Brassicogethes aeneus TaxID=1431903 RepID=A0A9P0BDD9_BRAAE|nr:unnamed protein product [Brassicogethes aeneus]